MKHSKQIALAIVLTLAVAAFLAAQATWAKITGNVKNEDGKYLSNVTVTVTNIKSNATTSVKTAKKKGAFRFPSLEPGFYQVSCDLEGYESKVVSGIQLSADQSATLQIKLRKIADPEQQTTEN